ncbi:HAD family hydrolase [Streptomyces sp. adm13(2018)]|uniref:HAD-IA family hydrolase n=1 Tax=Streptomyces sp. adm13(2018) TaxID=2479007 RepID=UPI0011CD8130|nr:HAD-IA family hydrolase [Streptomyces sp. adm13(2018)]TXS07825.1 HAD family hydrolase [Streptomyces sp. adm13(2018)]
MPAPEPWVLFDIDGTLVDSSRLIEQVWREVAAEFEADPEAILAECHGRRDAEIVPMFFRPPDVPAVLARIQELEAAGGDLLSPVPGAPELLASLAPGRWAAVTSGPSGLMTGRLRAAGLPVPAVLVAADHVEHGKPHPEGYLAAARALGAAPEACVVVEDAPAGVAAGGRAGMFVAALTTTHPADRLTGADVVLDRLVDLPEVWSPARSGRS